MCQSTAPQGSEVEVAASLVALHDQLFGFEACHLQPLPVHEAALILVWVRGYGVIDLLGRRGGCIPAAESKSVR